MHYSAAVGSGHLGKHNPQHQTNSRVRLLYERWVHWVFALSCSEGTQSYRNVGRGGGGGGGVITSKGASGISANNQL